MRLKRGNGANQCRSIVLRFFVKFSGVVGLVQPGGSLAEHTPAAFVFIAVDLPFVANKIVESDSGHVRFSG